MKTHDHFCGNVPVSTVTKKLDLRIIIWYGSDTSLLKARTASILQRYVFLFPSNIIMSFKWTLLYIYEASVCSNMAATRNP